MCNNRIEILNRFMHIQMTDSAFEIMTLLLFILHALYSG